MSESDGGAVMFAISKFPPDRQREIYEDDYDAHYQRMCDWCGDDVANTIECTLASDPKWASVDVGVGGNYLTAQGTKHKYAPVYWGDDFQLAHVTYDLDGLRCTRRNPLTECEALKQWVGLTLVEAMVVNVVRSYGDIRAGRDGEYSRFKTSIEVDRETIDVNDDIELAFSEFFATADHDGIDTSFVVSNTFSPFFTGVNVFVDVLDSDVDALRNEFLTAMAKVRDFFEELHHTIRDTLKADWEHMISFEYWLDFVEANELEFDPEKYNINIEEIENVQQETRYRHRAGRSVAAHQ